LLNRVNISSFFSPIQMKRCPECRKDYADDSLMYCLDDGTPLVQGRVIEEPATMLLSGEGASDGITRTEPPRSAASQASKLPWLAALLFLSVALVFAYGYFKRPPAQDQQAMRVAFVPPADLSFNDAQYDSAVISPDGKKIAFSATDASGKNWLYYRDLDSIEAKQLPGSQIPWRHSGRRTASRSRTDQMGS
jgi:hypothetical protein